MSVKIPCTLINVTHYAPIRFCIACRLACQSTLPSPGGAGGDDFFVSGGSLDDGYVASKIDTSITLGSRRMSFGK